MRIVSFVCYGPFFETHVSSGQSIPGYPFLVPGESKNRLQGNMVPQSYDYSCLEVFAINVTKCQ